MLAKRIIPCLDVDRGRVVKGVRFVALRDAGDPVECAARYDAEGADELVLLDITASSDARPILIDVVRRVADAVYLPFTVGGGVRSVEDADALLRAGADKVAVNTAAVNDPSLITRLAERFGAQAIVLAIDARRSAGNAGPTKSAGLAAAPWGGLGARSEAEPPSLNDASQMEGSVSPRGPSLAVNCRSSSEASQMEGSVSPPGPPLAVNCRSSSEASQMEGSVSPPGPSHAVNCRSSSEASQMEGSVSPPGPPRAVNCSSSSDASQTEGSVSPPHWQVFIHGGRTPTGWDAVAWAREGAARGAGEILLTSMDRDGTRDGFDMALTRAVAEAVRVPVIASGGCGTVAHLAEALGAGRAAAALAASIFHFGEIRIRDAKAQLRAAGIEVRL